MSSSCPSFLALVKKRKFLYFWFFLLGHVLCHIGYFRGARVNADTDEQRLARALKNDELDAKFGFERYKEPKERTGFMLNMQPVGLTLLLLYKPDDFNTLFVCFALRMSCWMRRRRS
jgi:hypothetical protein